VLWRKPPDHDKAELEARFLQLCEQYHNLAVWCDREAPVTLPPAAGEASTYGYLDAEELARRVRDELRLGERPATSLLRVLEEACGVKVFHLAFSSEGSAAATVGEAFGPAVLLNASTAPWRRVFDLAHELFHILTWDVFRGSRTVPGVCSGEEHEEKLAGCFARNLLLPAEALKTALYQRAKQGRVTYGALVEIAREFEVSVDAVVWGVSFLHGQTWSDEERAEHVARAKAIEAHFDRRPRAEPPRWPERYFALAAEALRRGLISTGRFAEYVDMSRQEAMEYADQELPDDEEVQVDRA
jgi:XRE family transcriptional regulator, fatty acid utilization regulator